MSKVTQQNWDWNGGGLQPLHSKPPHGTSRKKAIVAFLCPPLSFVLVIDKLYQRKEPVVSSVHTKVKGVAEVREEIVENGMKKVVQTVFDTADYTFPLQVTDCLSAASHQGPAPLPWDLEPYSRKTPALF